MRAFDWFCLLLAFGLCGFGLIFLIGGIANAVDPERSTLVFSLVALLLGAVPCLAGLWIGLRTQRNARRRSLQDAERLVLKLASAREGRLTATEVALNTSITMEEATQLLNRFNLDGIAEMQVSDSGVVEYTFPSLERPETSSP